MGFDNSLSKADSWREKRYGLEPRDTAGTEWVYCPNCGQATKIKGLGQHMVEMHGAVVRKKGMSWQLPMPTTANATMGNAKQ